MFLICFWYVFANEKSSKTLEWAQNVESVESGSLVQIVTVGGKTSFDKL